MKPEQSAKNDHFKLYTSFKSFFEMCKPHKLPFAWFLTLLQRLRSFCVFVFMFISFSTFYVSCLIFYVCESRATLMSVSAAIGLDIYC